jgi:hypothetical protein
MGVISTTTFDPLRKYVNVRLQQGVPLIDADWNELDDIRKFEVRAFLKWFVGDGVPVGSDAFRIEGTGDTNSFLIHSGVDKTTIPAGTSDQELGLRYVGNCLVDGLDVIVSDDIKFTDQSLHASRNPSAQLLATTADGGAITALTTPTTAGTLVIYLDVWEHLVTVADDPTLALPGISTESCARIKREWAVRVDTSLPVPGTAPLFVAGHSYYELATLTRRANDATINPGDIVDKRTTRLTLSDLLRRVSIIEQATIIPAFDAPVHPDSQFSPASGNIGTTITLHGRNFLLSKPRVFFGSVEATVIGGVNSNTFKGFELTANVPAGVTAQSKISVQTDGGTATSDSLFTVIGAPFFAAPGSQFTPTGALPGQQVTLNGTNFNGNNLTVTLISVASATNQGIAPTSVTPNPAGTQITITIPTPTPAGYGPYHVSVSTAAGVAISDDVFTLQANPPTFAAPGSQFSPTSATAGTAATVTLVGNHFDALPISVTFNPASGSPVAVGSTFVDANHITVSTASVTTAGQYKITVTTPGGSVTSADTFTIRTKGKDGAKDGAKDGNKDVVKEGGKDAGKEAALEKVHVDVVTPAQPLEKVHIDAKIADALNPVLPRNVINNAIGGAGGIAQPAVGHAFISTAERPDVEGNVLQQADGHSGD